MHVHYFVWYEIAGDVAPARAAIDAMMADIARATGVRGRLLMRRDRSATWMEVYESVADPPGFEREIANALARHDVGRFLAGGARHVEAFVAAN